MEQKGRPSGGEDLFDTALLLTLRDELRELKTQNDQRLAEVENTMKALANDVKKLVVLRTVETKSGDASPKSPAAPRKPEEPVASAAPKEEEEDGSNWNYVIAKRGGYNTLLSQTVRDLLEMGADAVQFLNFLAQKRDYDVRQQLQQLQAEYQKLQGNQLQEHFRELWKSQYTLLKHKQARTWKEEVFLNAFDAFIEWLQT